VIRTSKIYLDRKGGGRIYIPQEIRGALGWEHHEGIVLEQEDGRLILVSENKGRKEAKQ
jgi:bifunctional DNA-binding transcriptional regulator/antitoxin component of YhaV-PrlF toxin-antitoxin module